MGVAVWLPSRCSQSVDYFVIYYIKFPIPSNTSRGCSEGVFWTGYPGIVRRTSWEYAIVPGRIESGANPVGQHGGAQFHFFASCFAMYYIFGYMGSEYNDVMTKHNYMYKGIGWLCASVPPVVWEGLGSRNEEIHKQTYLAFLRISPELPGVLSGASGRSSGEWGGGVAVMLRDPPALEGVLGRLERAGEDAL